MDHSPRARRGLDQPRQVEQRSDSGCKRWLRRIVDVCTSRVIRRRCNQELCESVSRRVDHLQDHDP